MAVITEEIDAGDMAAMPTVDVAGGPELGTRVREEVHFAEVIASGQELFLVGPTDGIDVGSVGAFWPHSKDMESQSAGVCSPFNVSRSFHTYDLLTSRRDPIEDFIVSRI